VGLGVNPQKTCFKALLLPFIQKIRGAYAVVARIIGKRM